MKKWLAAALCTAAAMSASSALAANINFVTAGTSSTFYPISATVCQLWNDSIEGMRATATPSGGGIDNLNQALDGEAQIGIANANLVYQAQQGTDSFEGYANENLRIFAGLYYNPNQVVVTRDSGIETLEDLVGKHISVGAAGSTTVDEATVHLALLGKTLDDLKAEYMGTSESADAISNKQLDGVWVMAGTPNAAVTQIMTTTDAKILPIPAETVEALKENYPWYANYTIPAGTYAGQDEDVPTSAVKLTLFVTADVDEETVYQMTKTCYDGITDAGPAVILMVGIGILFLAVTNASVKEVLNPLLLAIVPTSRMPYIIFFAILAPLALYRGPMNMFGLGSGIAALIIGLGTLNPLAVMAAFLAAERIQCGGDPTNTQNVWTANFCEVDVNTCTKKMLPYLWAVSIVGVILGAMLYF